VIRRERGTPQGSAVSPALANLFLHYALDAWLARTFPDVEFARYVDDAVVHCRTEARAIQVRDAIAERMRQVGLQLHPDKTRIVYCQDSNRRGSYEHTHRLRSWASLFGSEEHATGGARPSVGSCQRAATWPRSR
jgi:retron-type reverse transcriptase